MLKIALTIPSDLAEQVLPLSLRQQILIAGLKDFVFDSLR